MAHKPVFLQNIQVQLPVADIQRAKKFYQEIFNFVVEYENERIVRFDNNIHLISGKKDKEPMPDMVPRLVFWVPSAAIAYKDLLDRGMSIDSSPEQTSFGKGFFFFDSEGNYCLIVESP